MPPSRRRDRLRNRQGAHHPRKARHRILPGGRGLLPERRRHHLGRHRSGGAQLLRPAGRRAGDRMVSQDVPEIMDDKERTQAAKHPLYLSQLPQGDDRVASPGARLQRVRGLPVRGGSSHGCRRRRQLQPPTSPSRASSPKRSIPSPASPRAITGFAARSSRRCERSGCNPYADFSATSSITCRVSARFTAGCPATSSPTGTSAAR